MPLQTRADFGRRAAAFYRTGTGAEVGTRFGLFARRIAMHYPGRVVCVDLWTDEEIFEVARTLLEDKRFHLYRGDSPDVAEHFADEGLDWVYIDADHTYESVRADLAAWFPKLRPGGLMAGHDYVERHGWGVKQAVDEFAAAYGHTVAATTQDLWQGQPFPTWYFTK